MIITGLYACRAKLDAEARAARDDPRAAALAAAATRSAQQAAAAASAAGVAGAAPATLPPQQPGKRPLAALFMFKVLVVEPTASPVHSVASSTIMRGLVGKTFRLTLPNRLLNLQPPSDNMPGWWVVRAIVMPLAFLGMLYMCRYRMAMKPPFGTLQHRAVARM